MVTVLKQRFIKDLWNSLWTTRNCRWPPMVHLDHV